MGTKANPAEYDCYANAEPDEPMFVLLARDRHAPALVWLWSVLREVDGEDPEKVREARQCCADMMTWAHEHGRQIQGLGVAALAAVMELVRVANMRMDHKPTNQETNLEVMRGFFCRTKFEADAEEADGKGAGK